MVWVLLMCSSVVRCLRLKAAAPLIFGRFVFCTQARTSAPSFCRLSACLGCGPSWRALYLRILYSPYLLVSYFCMLNRPGWWIL